MKLKLIILVGTGFLAIESWALDSFSYSGRLVNSNGSPVTGPVNLKFDLSSTEDSDLLCSKTVSDVPLSQGIFNVKLDFLPADCENHTIQSIMESIPSGHSLTYQVTDLTNSRSYSHQTIYSVPSSFMASFAKSLGSMGATTDGQVLKWSAAAGKWIPGSVGTGNGTLTSIITGSGLAGGPIENSGTIFIAPGGVQDSHLASGIDPAKLAGTRDSSKYLKGDSTWSSFEADLLATILTGFSLPAPATAVSSGDTVLEAFGKLQGQIEDLDTSKLGNTGGTLIVGTIDGVPAPTMPGQIVNKKYVDDLVAGVGPSQWITATPHIHYNDGNVGIGTSTPVSILDIQSVNSGILIPRMTELQRDAIILPAGMQIYNTITNRINFHDGTSWKELGVSGSGVQSISTGTGIVSTTITGTGTIAVDVGTSSGKIPQLDGSGKLPTTVETDPTVSSFAKSSLPTCGAGEVLSSNGTSFNCATDANSILTTDDSSLATSGSVIRIKAQGILDTHLSGLTTGCGAGQILATNGLGSFFCADRYWGLEPDNIFSLDAVAIGGNTASASAILDLQSSTKGFLPPRMSTAERDAITAPSNGLVIYNTSSNQIEFFNGTGWSTSNTFVGTRATSDIVQAGSLADTKLNLNAKTFDVGNNFDLATDRFQPTVAGKYLVTLQIHASSQSNGDHNISAIYKNGSMYERRFTRSISAGNSESTIVTLVDMNGSTDFIEPYFSLSAGNAVAVTFTASLQSPGSSAGGGGGAITSNSVDGTHIQDGTITSADIAPNTVSVSNLDFASNEGINLPQQAANPATGTAGQTYFNTTTKTLMFHDGTSWQAVGAGSGDVGGTPGFAWVNFNGQSCPSNICAIYSGHNISQVQKTGVGLYTITFSTPMPNTNYPITFGIGDSTSSVLSTVSRDLNNLTLRNVAVSGGALVDATMNTVVVGISGSAGNGGQWTTAGANIHFNSGNVGIGTAAPVSNLHIQNPMGTASAIIEGVGAASNSGLNFIAGGETASIIQNQTNNIFGLRNASSGNMHLGIDQTGNIGIGTITPSTKLDVAGDIKASGDICSSDGATCMSTLASGSTKWSLNGANIYRNSNVGIGTASPLSQFHIANGVNAIMRLDSGPGLASSILHYNGATAGSGLAFFPAADGRVLSVLGSDLINNNAKLTVLQNGNVGIGTITPSTKFDVVGGIKASGDICSAGGATCMSTLASGSSKWSLNGSDIYRNSKVGVGTSTPGVKLHLLTNDSSSQLRLEGTGTYNAWMEYRPSDSGAENWNTGADVNGFKIHNQTDNTTRLLIDNNGNVGVGTTNPQQKLTVSDSAEPVIRLDRSGAGLFDWEIYAKNGALLFRGGADNVGTGLTDFMTIDSLGKVGIGTAAPTSRLTIEEDGTTPGLELKYGGANNFATIKGPLNRALRMDIPGNDTGDGLLIRGSQDSGATYPNNVLFARADGNVGIGTTSPSTKLHVQDGHLTVTNPSNNWQATFFKTSLTNAYLTLGATDTYAAIQGYSDGGGSRPLILQPVNGNVGIGTTSPQNMLTIGTNNGTGYALSANSPTAFGVNIITSQATPTNSAALWVRTTPDGGSNFKDLFRVQNNGKVGIGTTNPSTELHVTGRIAATDWIGAGCEGACDAGNGYVLLESDGRIITNNVTSTCTKLGGTATFSCSSDERLKNNISLFTDGLDHILKLQPKTYYWNNDDKKELNYGFIAQEVQKVIPHAVTEQDRSDGVFLSLDQGAFTPYMINAIKDLNAKIDDNFALRIVSLEEENKKIWEENEKIREENKVMKQFLCEKYPEASFCSE